MVGVLGELMEPPLVFVCLFGGFLPLLFFVCLVWFGSVWFDLI